MYYVRIGLLYLNWYKHVISIVTNLLQGIYLVIHLQLNFINFLAGKCRETFKSLHFEIMECNVTKASDIIEFLRGIANMNHSHYDCFLLYISTHGGHGYMCCSDFKINKKKELQRGYIPFSVLVELFLPDKCSSLSKKPKLFFFDCCRSIISTYI